MTTIHTSTDAANLSRFEIGSSAFGVAVSMMLPACRSVGMQVDPTTARELSAALLKHADDSERAEIQRWNAEAIREEIARAEAWSRRARAEADFAEQVRAIARANRAESAAVEADAWELFKAANPDTRRKSFDKVNARVADDFRRIARRARQLAVERAK